MLPYSFFLVHRWACPPWVCFPCVALHSFWCCLCHLTPSRVCHPQQCASAFFPVGVRSWSGILPQSGGQFDLKPSAMSNEETLCYSSGGVILCSIGARYDSYCSNLARSFLVDPTPAQEKAYKVRPSRCANFICPTRRRAPRSRAPRSRTGKRGASSCLVQSFCGSPSLQCSPEHSRHALAGSRA